MWGLLVIEWLPLVLITASSPSGTWITPDGESRTLRCPVLAEYGPVTAVPQGCSLERPSACYTLKEHEETMALVSGLQGELKHLRGTVVTQAKLVEDLTLATKQNLADLALLNARLAEVQDPPSRSAWFLGGAAAALGAVVGVWLLF